DALKDRQMLLVAAGVLGQIKADAGPAVAILAPVIRDEKDPLYRVEAVQALYQVDRQNPQIVPALTALLGDKDPRICQQAAVNLRSMMKESKGAFALLVEALGHRDPVVRWIAVDGLTQCGADGVPPLMKALASGDAASRKQAAAALGRMGS